MQSKVLVLGGTGKTGRKVVEGLTFLGQEVRVGSRSANPSFDWQNTSGWAAALEGIDKVYITFQPDLAVPGALEAIEGLTRQAKKSGVKKLVLLSGKGEREAELCEQVVIHSGINYSIIRASWFNQNFSESFFLDPILAGHVALPQPQAKVPYVDTTDIADVAVAAIMDDSHNGKIYQLTGPRLWTFEEIVDTIAGETGREITYTPVSMEAYNDMLKQFGLPEDYQWLINYLFTEVLANEKNSVITNDIEEVLGRKAKDFSEYARETAASGIWEPQLD
ncbi:MAG: NmrA family NAD(P)-binding protein [Flavobacteriaceae bacterium]